MIKVNVIRPWLNQDLFDSSMIGIRSKSKYSVSQGTLPSAASYSDDEEPLLPYYATSMIIARDITICGIDTKDEETKL